MSSRPDVGVVIVAAGRGTRAGGETPKQFRLLAGVPMLAWPLAAFLAHPAVATVAVVLPEDLAAAPPGWLVGFGGERVRLVAGGAERIDSVEQGVKALGAGQSVVVIHDGARPFVGRETIDRVIATARRGRGAVAAVPVSDTLKRVAGSTVSETVGRDGLWRAQTPQAFPAELLAAGLARARAVGLVATDDAAMVELIGGEVEVVPDQTANMKVTSAADLLIADAVARGA